MPHRTHTHTQLNMNFSRRWAIKPPQKVVVFAKLICHLLLTSSETRTHSQIQLYTCVCVLFNAPLTMSTQNRIRGKFLANMSCIKLAKRTPKSRLARQKAERKRNARKLGEKRKVTSINFGFQVAYAAICLYRKYPESFSSHNTPHHLLAPVPPPLTAISMLLRNF